MASKHCQIKIPYRAAGIHRLLGLTYLLLLTIPLSGCSLFEGLPEDGGKKRTVTDPEPAEITEVPPNAPVPATDLRQWRRISLDLTRNLPKTTDIFDLFDEDITLADLIATLIDSPDMHKTIAEWHRISWNLDSRHLPDFEAYIAQGDAVLDATLTDAIRRDVVAEPVKTLRYHLEQKTPFPDMFTSSFNVVPINLLTIWGQLQSGTPWVGEPYRIASYSDGRPSAGLLVSNGTLAHVPGANSNVSGRRTHELLKRFGCVDLDDSSPHNFLELEPEFQDDDLRQVASTHTKCASCHANFLDAQPSLAGLGTGTSFSAWLTYSPAASTAGSYAGHNLVDLGDFAQKFGRDPRIHRCTVEKLITTLNQRPVNEQDDESVVLALQNFYDNNYNLIEGIQSLIDSLEYRWQDVNTSVGDTYLRNSSGLRFLSKIHWEGILQSLGPSAAAIIVPEDLHPGIEEVRATQGHSVPGGAYWHHTLNVARQIADAIVNDELGDGTLAQSRKLLKLLPDGSTAGTSTFTVMAQVREVYLYLTSYSLNQNTMRHDAYEELWEAALDGGTTGNDYREAWRTMLVALFTDLWFLRI